MSASFRVTTTRSWHTAVAAIRLSMSGILRPSLSACPWIRPQVRATASSTSRIRPLNLSFSSLSTQDRIARRLLGSSSLAMPL